MNFKTALVVLLALVVGFGVLVRIATRLPEPPALEMPARDSPSSRRKTRVFEPPIETSRQSPAGWYGLALGPPIVSLSRPET